MNLSTSLAAGLFALLVISECAAQSPFTATTSISANQITAPAAGSHATIRGVASPRSILDPYRASQFVTNDVQVTNPEGVFKLSSRTAFERLAVDPGQQTMAAGCNITESDVADAAELAMSECSQNPNSNSCSAAMTRYLQMADQLMGCF